MLSRLDAVAQSADFAMEPLRCHKNAVAVECSIKNTAMGGTPIVYMLLGGRTSVFTTDRSGNVRAT